MSIIVSSSARHREYTEPLLTQTPLVLLLVASTGVSLWATVILIRILIAIPVGDTLPYFQRVGQSLVWPCKHSTHS